MRQVMHGLQVMSRSRLVRPGGRGVGLGGGGELGQGNTTSEVM